METEEIIMEWNEDKVDRKFIKIMEEILNSDKQEKDSFWYENLQLRMAK